MSEQMYGTIRDTLTTRGLEMLTEIWVLAGRPAT